MGAGRYDRNHYLGIINALRLRVVGLAQAGCGIRRSNRPGTADQLLKIARLPRWLNILGLLVIITLAVVYGLFTFCPPHLPAFQDPVTGGYGI